MKRLVSVLRACRVDMYGLGLPAGHGSTQQSQQPSHEPDRQRAALGERKELVEKQQTGGERTGRRLAGLRRRREGRSDQIKVRSRWRLQLPVDRGRNH